MTCVKSSWRKHFVYGVRHDDRAFENSVTVVFEATHYMMKLYHHRQHKKYTVRDSIKEVVWRKEIKEWMTESVRSRSVSKSSAGISPHFGINGSGTYGRFLWSFRYNSKFPGAAGDQQQHLVAIRLSSQDRGQQVKPPSPQDHHRISHYQPRIFANDGELEGQRRGRDWRKKFSSPERNRAHGGR